MEFFRVTSVDDEKFNTAMELYKVSFPKREQREEKSQKKILSDNEYHFDTVFDGKIFVGMILYWETEEFIYVEHFCINTELRNKGYGKKILEKINQKGKCVILEIDPPIDEISIRRKGFYERVGYNENSYIHIHPPYHTKNSGHKLTVMSYPNPLKDTEYNKFKEYLDNTVMAN